MRRRKENNKYKKILLAILFILLICAICYIIYNCINANKNKSLYRDIIPDKTTDDISKVTSEFTEKVKELQKENTDIKENIKILGLLYALGVVSGIIIELVIRLI